MKKSIRIIALLVGAAMLFLHIPERAAAAPVGGTYLNCLQDAGCGDLVSPGSPLFQKRWFGGSWPRWRLGILRLYRNRLGPSGDGSDSNLPDTQSAMISFSADLSGMSPQAEANVGSLEVDQFDSSLGTLNSVSIRLENVFDWTVMAENTSSASADLIGRLDQNLTVEQNSADLLIHQTSFGQTWNMLVFDGLVDFAGTSGFTELYYDTESDALVLTGTDMLPYIGSGTVAFDVFTSSQAAFTSSGNGILGCEQAFTVTLLVEYDYVPVSVPPPLLLLGSGLMSLIRLRWCRIKKS